MTAIEPLKLGSSGRAVTFLQRRLGVAQTGSYDATTQAAVMALQTRHGMLVDGVYGPLTNKAATGRSADQLAAAARFLAVPEAVLQTVVQVETSGSGFLDDGRPKILLERHYVWKYALTEARLHLSEDVCAPEPGGYLGGAAEWDRLAQVAAVLGGAVAGMCCSWGLPQIMGANFATAGCASFADFADIMTLNEDAQIGLLSRFLASQPYLTIALRARDWAGVARRYNGPANVDAYAERLAAAYAQLTGDVA